jgi:hypothetical protein
MWETTETCKFGCENAECKGAFLGLNSSIVYYGTIGFVALLVVLVLFFISKRVKRNKQ